jgi:hypothetical protein
LNRYHFSIYIHVYTVFVLYSPFHTLPTSSHLPLVPAPPLPRMDLLCTPVLWFVKTKRDFCLFKIATQGVSLYVYIKMWIGSYLFFFFLP